MAAPVAGAAAEVASAVLASTHPPRLRRGLLAPPPGLTASMVTYVGRTHTRFRLLTGFSQPGSGGGRARTPGSLAGRPAAAGRAGLGGGARGRWRVRRQGLRPPRRDQREAAGRRVGGGRAAARAPRRRGPGGVRVRRR